MSTEVKMAIIPDCDICKYGIRSFGIPPTVPHRKAAYDGKTTISASWAYMCEEHWSEVGIGRLGTGYGQRLIQREDPPKVKTAAQRLKDQLVQPEDLEEEFMDRCPKCNEFIDYCQGHGANNICDCAWMPGDSEHELHCATREFTEEEL